MSDSRFIHSASSTSVIRKIQFLGLQEVNRAGNALFHVVTDYIKNPCVMFKVTNGSISYLWPLPSLSDFAAIRTGHRELIGKHEEWRRIFWDLIHSDVDGAHPCTLALEVTTHPQETQAGRYVRRQEYNLLSVPADVKVKLGVPDKFLVMMDEKQFDLITLEAV